jgi:hypothetical protein
VERKKRKYLGVGGELCRNVVKKRNIQEEGTYTVNTIGWEEKENHRGMEGGGVKILVAKDNRIYLMREKENEKENNLRRGEREYWRSRRVVQIAMVPRIIIVIF